MDKRISNLQAASTNLLNLIRHKDEYGKTYAVYEATVSESPAGLVFGGCLPYERALSSAVEKLEDALYQSGSLYVEANPGEFIEYMI